jgi:UDP-3-O-[3-hydroxymyristoyl] glucosamine N-acyltransferase
MSMRYSLGEIVANLGGELLGKDEVVNGAASLANAQPGQISFLADSRYRSLLGESLASALIIGLENRDITDLPRIVTANPYAYFARVVNLFHPAPKAEKGVSANVVVGSGTCIPETASISAHCTIGRNVILGENVRMEAGCVIGDNVSISDNTALHANVVIHHDCIIGSHCNLFAGSVIGADGFGYAEDNGNWVKIPQVGRVIIGDNVDVGANTTIDRGALDDTVIEDGVKIDNLVQIGHNCRIGAHSVIAGCVGIAGSARIGKHCRIGGAAMILGHLDIADKVTISPGSMITRSLRKAGTYTALMPFQTHEDWLETAAALRHLAKLSEQVKALEKELAAIRSQVTEEKKN